MSLRIISKVLNSNMEKEFKEQLDELKGQARRLAGRL
jgi:hypothetical protein